MEKLNTVKNFVETPTDLRSRQEHSKSIEEGERYKAIDTLVGLGMLIPLSEQELWHGRVGRGDENEDWRVDPNFKNGGNDSGNKNVNLRPTLYTGDIDVATDFANARAMRSQQNGNIEVHKIMSDNPDAMIIDASFNPNSLNQEDFSRYFAAASTLNDINWSNLEFSFEDRGVQPAEAIRLVEEGRSTHEVEQLSGLSPDGQSKLDSTIKTNKLFWDYPDWTTIQYLNSSGQDIYFSTDEGTTLLDTDWISNIYKNANVIGVKTTVDSGTLKRTLDTVSFFDLNAVNPENEILKDNYKMQRRLGGVAIGLDRLLPNEEAGHEVIDLLNDPHVKPEDLVAAASKVEGFEEVFNWSAGNWEGYSLGEHTETVLRNFEENYADKIPVSLLPPLRLALLTHDIGKSIATMDNKKEQQDVYNSHYASVFMNTLNIDKRMQAFVLGVTGGGMPWTYNLHRASTPEDKQWALDNLRYNAYYTMLEAGDKGYVTEEDIDGYIKSSEMAWMSDAGAYTDMAVTVDSRSGARYRNYPAFNKSFKRPTDTVKHEIKV